MRGIDDTCDALPHFQLPKPKTWPNSCVMDRVTRRSPSCSTSLTAPVIGIVIANVYLQPTDVRVPLCIGLWSDTIDTSCIVALVVNGFPLMTTTLAIP